VGGKDAYSFGPVLGEMDIYLFNEGTHYEVYKKTGRRISWRLAACTERILPLGAKCPEGQP